MFLQLHSDPPRGGAGDRSGARSCTLEGRCSEPMESQTGRAALHQPALPPLQRSLYECSLVAMETCLGVAVIVNQDLLLFPFHRQLCILMD